MVAHRVVKISREADLVHNLCEESVSRAKFAYKLQSTVYSLLLQLQVAVAVAVAYKVESTTYKKMYRYFPVQKKIFAHTYKHKHSTQLLL